jgi:hypothetical protein
MEYRLLASGDWLLASGDWLLADHQQMVNSLNSLIVK